MDKNGQSSQVQGPPLHPCGASEEGAGCICHGGQIEGTQIWPGLPISTLWDQHLLH